MQDAVDTEFHGFLPPGHVDSACSAYQWAIPWYVRMGLRTIEIAGNPEGFVGNATLANTEKAREGIEALLDYMTKLHDDIL
jgi:creatinine amidohydrolase/Fe(II)-dependent formamide hydrolase-like protein